MENVLILGGSQTDFERNWTKEGKGYQALIKEVFEDTIKKCNISKDEIKRLNEENKIESFVGNFIAENYIDQGHLGALLTNVDKCFYGIPSARYEAACASGSVAISSAISKIKSGEIDVAIVLGFELMKTVNSKKCGEYLGKAAIYEEESKGIELPFPKLFGRLAEETVKKYDLDEERYLNALAKISEINYNNAKRNKNAQTRKWFMNLKNAQYRNTENNPNVGGLLASSDCSQITDGAAMIILISESYAKNRYNNTYKQLPIIKGEGHRNAPMRFSDKIEESKDNEYILPWTRLAVEEACKKAKLKENEIDFFETHDCFTSSEYVAISCFGITKPGEEYKAIEEGRIAFDGDKPINPSGGLIGCGHPVGATGVRMMLDLYKQLTGKAEGYQLKDVKNGLMLNIGGSATTNYVFVVGNRGE